MCGRTTPSRLQHHVPPQERFHTFVCGDTGLESALVRLLLSPHDVAIKTLFHVRHLPHAPAPFTPTVCFVFFLFSFGLGCLTYGALPPLTYGALEAA